jgi:hypothetical protein
MRVKHLIVVLAMVVAGTAGADPLPSPQQIDDCIAYVSFLSVMANHRKYSNATQSQMNEDYLRRTFGGESSLLLQGMRPSNDAERKTFAKVEARAYKVIANADMARINILATHDPSFCMEYANDVVTWRPISK